MSNKKYFTISPSSLDNVEMCFQKYGFKKVRGIIYPKPQTHLLQGKLGHEGLEHWYKLKIENKLDVPTRLESTSMHIRERSLAYPTLGPDEKQAIFDAVRDYITHYMHENWVPKYVEQPFSKVLYDDEFLCIILEGKIDLGFALEDRPRIADHKFRWSKWPLLSLKNQFIAYAYATGSKTVCDDAIYVYKKGAEFVRTTFSYDQEQIDEWVKETVPYWVKELIKQIEVNKFIPNYSSCDKYGGCEYGGICSVPRSLRESVILSEYVPQQSEGLYDDE
jgi:hypothetical protein